MPLNPPGQVVGVSTWKTEALYRAQSIDLSLNLLIDNEFAVSNDAATFVSITGTVTYDTGLSGGWVRLKTGAGPLANAGVYNAGGAALIGAPANESWYVQSRCWIKDVPIGTSVYYAVTLQNDLTVNRKFISLVFDAAVDPTCLAIDMQLGTGGPRTTYISTAAADIGAPHDYGLGRDAVNDKIYAVVDGVPILEIDGPFANLTVDPCFQYSAVAGDAAGQDIELWVDNAGTVLQRI